MAGLEQTIQVIRAMMNSICDFLTLTMEPILDFGGFLPTMYMFYSKPMASNMCLQQISAMPEIMEIATLNQEMIRRMVNTSEDMDVSSRLQVLDTFTQKVINSGYGLRQTSNIMVRGLKGYERKLKLSQKEKEDLGEE